MATATPARLSSPSVVLYVEDDDGTAAVFRMVLTDLAPSVKLFILQDAKQTFKFLHQEFPYGDAPHPDLIILDVNLPGENGFEILARIRRETASGAVPTVFFTSSEATRDQQQSRALGVEMMHKPMYLTDFEKAVMSLLGYIPEYC